MNANSKINKLQEMIYEMKVRDVMTRQVITVHPREHMSTLRALLRLNRISGLPVVETGQLVGLISVEDFIRHLADRCQDRPIGECMTTAVTTVNSDDPLVLAFGKFDRLGMGRFPVVERDTRRLVGILTKGDVIEGLLRKLEIDFEEEQIRHYEPSHVFEDLEADEASIHLVYQVKGQDFERAGTGSSRLKRTLRRLSVRPDVVRRIAIASYEAEMNLVVFTRGGTISATVGRDAVDVEVTDGGPGIPDIERALQPGYSTATDWVRELGFGAGMGLPNIQKSSDRFAIESVVGKGTRVRSTFFTVGANHDAE